MSNYLSERRKELGLTQKEVADAVGVAEATVSRWESGEIANMRRDRISALAKILKCSADFIMTGNQNAPTVPPGFEPLPEMATVPLVGRIACGQPITAEENLEGYVSIPAEWHATFTLLCEGDSMEPRIKDGDLVAAECDTLMEAVTEPRARAFVALCLYCGLRREEALGLKWTDLGADRLVVSRAMTFGSNQQLPVEELKNTASCRMLPMPDKLRQVLATTPRLAEYVVPAANGGDMTLSAFRRLWTSHVRRQVGFELRPHMLRHTYATMLYRAGVDLRTAQQLLGHANIQMTARIYTHLEAEDSLKVQDRINLYLSGAPTATATG